MNNSHKQTFTIISNLLYIAVFFLAIAWFNWKLMIIFFLFGLALHYETEALDS
jgi:ABC-type bacteriocin/lantibiotic exporter with double-glycine peptidase domain